MNTPAPRKVCHLRATNFFGGPEKQILEHCRCLDPARWSPVIATFGEGREAVELDQRAREAGIEAFQIHTRSSFSPQAIGILRAELLERGIDVLVTHGYKSDLVGLLALRRQKKAQQKKTLQKKAPQEKAQQKTAQFVHMRGFTGEDWKVRLYERLDLWVLRRVPGVICVSEATRQLLVGKGIAPGLAHTVHNAIHIAENIHPADLSESFGIPKNARVLVAAGRLSPEKGHAVLVEAFDMLAERHQDLHLLTIGDGPLAGQLRRQAATQPGSDRIHFPGFRKDALACLAAGTLVVNPSYTEGLPNVVLEAFVAGTPVVATAVGGVPEIVEEAKTGLLVASGDASALAETIERALGDPDLAKTMAQRARCLVEEQFTFTAQAEKLMALYDAAAGCPPGNCQPARLAVLAGSTP